MLGAFRVAGPWPKPIDASAPRWPTPAFSAYIVMSRPGSGAGFRSSRRGGFLPLHLGDGGACRVADIEHFERFEIAFAHGRQSNVLIVACLRIAADRPAHF